MRNDLHVRCPCPPTTDGQRSLPGGQKVSYLDAENDPHFTFRFADVRIIPRFHPDGVEAGRRVTAYRPDADSGGRRGLLARACVGDGGWVALPEPITVPNWPTC